MQVCVRTEFLLLLSRAQKHNLHAGGASLFCNEQRTVDRLLHLKNVARDLTKHAHVTPKPRHAPRRKIAKSRCVANQGAICASGTRGHNRQATPNTVYSSMLSSYIASITQIPAPSDPAAKFPASARVGTPANDCCKSASCLYNAQGCVLSWIRT